MIRAVIADDESLARRRIRNLLQRATDVEVIAECANGRDAINVIEAASPDLLFLDIQMPEVNGFGVLEAIGPGLVPATIFVTAYDQFAVRAFEAHALDYLLKPFDDQRFEAALQRARTQIRMWKQQESDIDRRLLGLLEQVRGTQSRHLRRLVVRSERRTLIIPTEDIDWFEAQDNYIRLHVAGDTHLIRTTVTRLASALDPNDFIRIHRSTIVNVRRIQAIESRQGGHFVVTLYDGTTLTSSRNYRRKLLELLGRES